MAGRRGKRSYASTRPSGGALDGRGKTSGATFGVKTVTVFVGVSRALAMRTFLAGRDGIGVRTAGSAAEAKGRGGSRDRKLVELGGGSQIPVCVESLCARQVVPKRAVVIGAPIVMRTRRSIRRCLLGGTKES